MLVARQNRGVIFDLDGVLIQSGEAHRLAFEQVFSDFGINDFAYPPYAGWRTRDVFEDVLARHGQAADAGQLDQASARKSRLARQILDRGRPLDPDYGMVMASLAADYPLGLATSGSRASAEAFLRWTGAASLLASVLTSEDVQAAKPDPEIYVRSAGQLGVPAADCVVVEDAVSGVRAAKAAGATVIGLAGTVSGEHLLEAGAGTVIRHLAELPGVLARDQDPAPVEQSCWTTVIPAAGRGSRLGFDHPKILYPVAGRPILDWLLDVFEPYSNRLVFVLSPEGAGEVIQALEQRIPGRFDTVIQEVPTGMGDAVALALPRVRTPHVAVVWGDQVSLHPASVERTLRLHQGPLRPQVTCPTVVRSKPYIHFERDEAGRLCGLRQAREGDAMPEEGESDTGFFCFETSRLVELLGQQRASGAGTGSRTREFNLLPVIPAAARDGVVLTPRHMRLEETMGVNTREDAEAVSGFLARRANGREN